MVCVNLVVPFTLRTPSKTHSLFALTMIDPAKATTSHNPQENAIIERVHKVVNDMLRSFDLENNHETLE
jgi:hypothetical protein